MNQNPLQENTEQLNEAIKEMTAFEDSDPLHHLETTEELLTNLPIIQEQLRQQRQTIYDDILLLSEDVRQANLLNEEITTRAEQQRHLARGEFYEKMLQRITHENNFLERFTTIAKNQHDLLTTYTKITSEFEKHLDTHKTTEKPPSEEEIDNPPDLDWQIELTQRLISLCTETIRIREGKPINPSHYKNIDTALAMINELQTKYKNIVIQRLDQYQLPTMRIGWIELSKKETDLTNVKASITQLSEEYAELIKQRATNM